MGCKRFELGIRDRKSGQMLERSWSAEQVQENLPWLKHMNARGHDIYIRPEREHVRGLVLVKNLSPAGLAKLERDARGPALAVQTSRENYQAWIRVPSRASEAERGEIGRRLAREYDAEPASYGRLAGFANHQQEHRDRSRERDRDRDQDRDERSSRFALVRSASGRVAQDGELLLRQATRSVREQARTPSRERAQPSPPRPSISQNAERATELFRSRFAELSRTMNDRSRCDFSAAITLAERGFDRRAIEHAIRTGSPDLEERKPGHVEDYAHRTAGVALECAIERERNRGRESDLER